MKTMFKASLLFVCVLLLAGCSADELTDGKDKLPPDLEGMTLFEAKAAPSTRTAVMSWGDPPNGLLRLGWEMGDKIWIQKTPGSAEWIKNSSSRAFSWTEYQSGDWPRNDAVFVFPGRLTEDSYRVRYTGYTTMGGFYDSKAYDKVTIPSKQRLPWAYKGDYTKPFAIGENGDCGVAIARKNQYGRYVFQLEHKAAYIGIAPHSSNYTLTSEKDHGIYLKSIKVTADNAICGTFNFNDDGIDLSSRPAATDANKTITVEGCSIPGKEEEEHHTNTTLSVMVIAPGTYGTFKVEYVIVKKDDEENEVTITREYKNVTFTAGKVKWMHPDFRTEKYSRRDGHAKWRDSKVKECPNINEIRWYIEKGDPHWSKFFYWDTYRERICSYDGIWVKKLSVIAKENGKTVEELKAMAPDGTNYINTRINGFKQITGIPTGIPADTKDYFFIPALGDDPLGWVNKKEGFFWSSSESYDPYNIKAAYVLHFKEGMVEVMGEKKSKHLYLWEGL